MACLDKLASFLFYMMIVDFALEGLDFIHRVYQSEESIQILSQLISQRLFMSLVVIQLLLGMLVPLATIALTKIFRPPEEFRRLIYFISALLVQLGSSPQDGTSSWADSFSRRASEALPRIK